VSTASWHCITLHHTASHYNSLQRTACALSFEVVSTASCVSLSFLLIILTHYACDLSLEVVFTAFCFSWRSFCLSHVQSVSCLMSRSLRIKASWNLASVEPFHCGYRPQLIDRGTNPKKHLVWSCWYKSTYRVFMRSKFHCQEVSGAVVSCSVCLLTLSLGGCGVMFFRSLLVYPRRS